MVTLTWYGHSALKIEIAGKIVLIDPMLDLNPSSPVKASQIRQADVVYVTHDHPDHLGEAFEICKRTDALFVAVNELADFAFENGVKNVARVNIGGKLSIDGLRVTVTQAVHSTRMGLSTGVIIQGEDTTIYDAGDTALFSDLMLIGSHYRIDVACIPIGGIFTMDADEAVEAARMLEPKIVIPTHFGTFPILTKSATGFAEKVKMCLPKVQVLLLKPGESYVLASKTKKGKPVTLLQ